MAKWKTFFPAIAQQLYRAEINICSGYGVTKK